ncbi:membrane glycoprotein K1 [Colobine gammaherpesvirus 1]|uniref:Membrane glycoprotein K1 n=1 Tax=Colobine gammaherpesvirus 1 TaxID=2597325 RepID=A0A5B8G3V5_9GAMA|nr:membrane glycoprotein K1 [Colobine gammaherpesvirus 1]QDQ69211.1 membrane glycoprotein K1 [Colobine gammaherpesvirus 1]
MAASTVLFCIIGFWAFCDALRTPVLKSTPPWCPTTNGSRYSLQCGPNPRPSVKWFINGTQQTSMYKGKVNVTVSFSNSGNYTCAIKHSNQSNILDLGVTGTLVLQTQCSRPPWDARCNDTILLKCESAGNSGPFDFWHHQSNLSMQVGYGLRHYMFTLGNKTGGCYDCTTHMGAGRDRQEVSQQMCFNITCPPLDSHPIIKVNKQSPKTTTTSATTTKKIDLTSSSATTTRRSTTKKTTTSQTTKGQMNTIRQTTTTRLTSHSSPTLTQETTTGTRNHLEHTNESPATTALLNHIGTTDTSIKLSVTTEYTSSENATAMPIDNEEPVKTPMNNSGPQNNTTTNSSIPIIFETGTVTEGQHVSISVAGLVFLILLLGILLGIFLAICYLSIKRCMRNRWQQQQQDQQRAPQQERPQDRLPGRNEEQQEERRLDRRHHHRQAQRRPTPANQADYMQLLPRP